MILVSQSEEHFLKTINEFKYQLNWHTQYSWICGPLLHFSALIFKIHMFLRLNNQMSS